MVKYKYTIENEVCFFESDNEYPDIDLVAIDAAEDFYNKGKEYSNGSHYNSEWPKTVNIYEKTIDGKWLFSGVFDIEIQQEPTFVCF